uniref:Ig-like domain-containing protein n=1 Tax=Echeneis naucrates TaxID=173247 RepID=A0A665UF06_ECHNA
VEINCNYRYPSRINGQQTKVEETFWFAKGKIKDPVDLKTDSEYSGRVQYDCGQNDCTLRITDLRESDSAEYKFRFTTNQPGGKYTGSPGVTFPPAETVEGRSITLTCSSDANPAANITWYKEDQILVLKGPHLVLNNLRSSDSGQYHCTAENELGRRTSGNISIHVEYPPKNISVSVSPSAEMVEGSSVNLTCSSDANPAANITWYKEGEDSPKASGQIFTITDLRPEHIGNYSCEVQNTRGRRRSTLNLTVRTGELHTNCQTFGHTAFVGFESFVCITQTWSDFMLFIMSALESPLPRRLATFFTNIHQHSCLIPLLSSSPFLPH